MAGEANIAASSAILKRKYANGAPKLQFTTFPVYDAIDKDTSWEGDDMALPLQGENPQGLGTTILNAQNAGQQGDYRRFIISRLEYFAIARIKGQALRAAKGAGAVIDLWENEMEGVQAEFQKMIEIFAFGTGNGVLATVSAGATGTAWTLSVVEDTSNLSVGMSVQLVSDTTLSPTARVTVVKITQVNRAAGTVTVSGAVTGAANGDSIVRAGDQAVAGVAAVPTGWRQWLIGGSAPGTFKNVNRNDDPVRYASQALDMTGLPMAEAITDLESLITVVGHTPKKRLILNPRDLRQVRKSMFGKVNMMTTGGTANIGFSDAKWNGDGGEISTLVSPFCPRYNVFLKDMTTFKLYSVGPAPGILNNDDNQILRVATDDSYEVRFGMYGEFGERMPVNSARGVNYGL